MTTSHQSFEGLPIVVDAVMKFALAMLEYQTFRNQMVNHPAQVA
jgi:phosphatidylserine synthase